MFQFVEQKIQATLILKKRFLEILKKNGVETLNDFWICNSKNKFDFFFFAYQNNEPKTLSLNFYITDGIFGYDLNSYDEIDLDEESIEELKIIAEEYLRKFGPKKKDRQIQPIF